MPVNACPITTVLPCCMIPAKISCVPHPQRWGIIEQYQTLGEVLSKYNVVDPYDLDLNTPVISVSPVSNTYCSGKAEYAIELVNDKISHYFRRFFIGAYLSRHNPEDNFLTLVFPG